MSTLHDRPACFCGHDTTEHALRILKLSGTVILDSCEHEGCGCQVYDPDCPHDHCAPLTHDRGAVCLDCGAEETAP